MGCVSDINGFFVDDVACNLLAASYIRNLFGPPRRSKLRLYDGIGVIPAPTTGTVAQKLPRSSAGIALHRPRRSVDDRRKERAAESAGDQTCLNLCLRSTLVPCVSATDRGS